MSKWSHPSRVRGLKFGPADVAGHSDEVAPFTGAWIEIKNVSRSLRADAVAPFTGAWIEICSGSSRRRSG